MSMALQVQVEGQALAKLQRGLQGRRWHEQDSCPQRQAQKLQVVSRQGGHHQPSSQAELDSLVQS